MARKEPAEWVGSGSGDSPLRVAPELDPNEPTGGGAGEGRAPEEPRAVISAAELAVWQRTMGLNDSQAMAALGIASRHTWKKMRREGAGRTVALACAALIRGLKPWPQ